MATRTVTLDASGKILGRFATEISVILRGKDTPQYRQDRLPDITVRVTNAAAIRVTGRKLDQKLRYHFSGYPGGLKEHELWKDMEERPEMILRLAVKRMLASNRLREKLLKRLVIER